MRKEVRYHPEKAKELYDALQAVPRNNRNRRIAKSLDKIVDSVESVHAKVYNVYRTYKVTFGVFLSAWLFYNGMFGLVYPQIQFPHNVWFIVSWIALVPFAVWYIAYWIDRKRHPVAETYYFNDGQNLLKINLYPDRVIYVQQNDAYYRVTPDRFESIDEARFYTDKLLANFLFDFRFVKTLNCVKKKAKKHTAEFFVGKGYKTKNARPLRFIRCGHTFFRSTRFVVGDDRLPRFFAVNFYRFRLMRYGEGSYVPDVKYDKNEKGFGYEFLIRYEDVNDRDADIVLPEWFYESCISNGLPLPFEKNAE